MSELSTEPEIVTLEPQPVGVVRERVPMTALPEFFGRAFHAVFEATAQQGVVVVGPPLGIYFGMPTDTVDVAAGFPTDRPVAPAGSVTGDTLPGGRAGQILHVGSYDAMAETYGRLMAWLSEQGLAAGPVMWESYLTEPDPDAVDATLTRITWPVVE